MNETGILKLFTIERALFVFAKSVYVSGNQICNLSDLVPANNLYSCKVKSTNGWSI